MNKKKATRPLSTSATNHLSACLDVDSARVVAVVAVVGAVGARAAAVTAVAVAARVVTLPVATLVSGAEVVAVHKGGKGGPGEEDGVHDGKGPDGLEHVAGARGTPVEGAEVAAELVRPEAARTRVGGALGVADVAHVVDARDESADNGNVDDGDEEGVGGGAVVAEEGEEGPGEGEDGDDEEDEDRGRGEEVGIDEFVDEPGEHAHHDDLGRGCVSWGERPANETAQTGWRKPATNTGRWMRRDR